MSHLSYLIYPLHLHASAVPLGLFFCKFSLQQARVLSRGLCDKTPTTLASASQAILRVRIHPAREIGKGTRRGHLNAHGGDGVSALVMVTFMVACTITTMRVKLVMVASAR